MPSRELTATRAPVRDELDPETRALVEVVASEIVQAIGASDRRRAKSVEELTSDVAGLLTRVQEIEGALSESTIREDERRQLREATHRRLAPFRDSLIKRAVDVVLVLLSGGVLAWLGHAVGFFGGAP